MIFSWSARPADSLSLSLIQVSKLYSKVHRHDSDRQPLLIGWYGGIKPAVQVRPRHLESSLKTVDLELRSFSMLETDATKTNVLFWSWRARGSLCVGHGINSCYHAAFIPNRSHDVSKRSHSIPRNAIRKILDYMI